MSRMPCAVTDDPYFDESDYYERTGVYKNPSDDEEDTEEE